MKSNLEKDTNDLKELLFNPDLNIQDRDGRTVLNIMAEKNAELNSLNEFKSYNEQVVCNLVNHFGQFNEVSFSLLVSYIKNSKFAGGEIRKTFRDYVFGENTVNINFKGLVAKMVQKLNRTEFTLNEITSIFYDKLRIINPWLLGELLLASNWEKGVQFISELLREKSTYNGEFILTRIPYIIEMYDLTNKDEKISYALNSWYDLLTDEHKSVIKYYAKNYGYPMKHEYIEENDAKEDYIEKTRQLFVVKFGINILSKINSLVGRKEYATLNQR